MPGNGDIGGGSCHVKFAWTTGTGNQQGKVWTYDDTQTPNRQPRYRVRKTQGPEPGWTNLQEGEVLQVQWD